MDKSEKIGYHKGALETLRVYPMALLYYGVKSLGYARTVLFILCRAERDIRASKVSWHRTLKAASAP